MVLIKSISNAFADVVLMDGRELHVVAKPSTLGLLSVLAKKTPVETLFDVHTGASKAASDSREREATFRLGQMDMQFSVCDMLRAMANGAAEGIRPGLTLAADLVESMEVGHGGS